MSSISARRPWVAGALLIVLASSSAPAQGRTVVAMGSPSESDDCPLSDSACVPPPVVREFRGVWVATVGNLDWPSDPGLSTAEQKVELLALLDRAQALHFNAVILQVRPAGDALYPSKLEPWSEYLTGRQGRPPDPYYDPLKFAVEEAHARGLELHAWFNPYRARHPSAKGKLAVSHLSRRRPELVKKYGTQLWMDPGEPAVREQTLRVVLDVVKRYDIDGVHLDDYFYPYREKRANGSTDFPDDRSWRSYRRNRGKLDRDDWRRRNVDLLVAALHVGIAKAKPWVKFGISPFGIWRPGYPEGVKGFDAYEQLYADSRKWLREGWVDYFTPQLYWGMEREGRRYPDLLRWWVDQNAAGRHVWPGMYTNLVGEHPGRADSSEYNTREIVRQIDATRQQQGATGNVHFSMKVFLEDRDSIRAVLARGPYSQPALVPASPWMNSGLPRIPSVLVKRAVDGGVRLTLAPSRGEVVRWWVIQSHDPEGWSTRIVSGRLLGYRFAPAPETVVVTAIDRVGSASSRVALRLR